MYFYYELSNGKARTYNCETKKFKTMNTSDVYKQKKHFSLLKGCEASDEGLKQFVKDFMIWIREIRDNEVFKFDYLKYKSHEQVCKGLFKKLCHGKYEDMDDIDDIEYKFMEACNNSGLRYCKAGKYDCHGYDFTSQYPAILASTFDIPTKRGRVRTLKSIDKKTIEIGYYRMNITSDDERFKKVFLFSKDKVYTHISILFAMMCRDKEKFDVNIELIQEENNCYIYGKGAKDNIVTGQSIFGKWFKHLIALKNELPKNKLVKYMTSALWGRLCQYNRKFKTMDEINDEDLDVSITYDSDHDYYIRNIEQNGKGEDVYELVNCKKPYYSSVARFKPFLLSKSREMIGKVALKYIDDVVRIHTDNVTFNKQHDDVIFEAGTYKLSKEDKTTGLIQFRRDDCYKHFDNDKFTTKGFKDDI